LRTRAGAATVYHTYFIRHPDSTIGQLEKEVQLVEQTSIQPYVHHGYPPIEKLAVANWDDLNQFYVGMHENSELTTRTFDGSGPVTTGVPAAFNIAGGWYRTK
jgi:hypothetical protein